MNPLESPDGTTPGGFAADVGRLMARALFREHAKDGRPRVEVHLSQEQLALTCGLCVQTALDVLKQRGLLLPPLSPTEVSTNG